MLQGHSSYTMSKIYRTMRTSPHKIKVLGSFCFGFFFSTNRTYIEFRKWSIVFLENYRVTYRIILNIVVYNCLSYIDKCLYNLLYANADKIRRNRRCRLINFAFFSPPSYYNIIIIIRIENLYNSYIYI